MDGGAAVKVSGINRNSSPYAALVSPLLLSCLRLAVAASYTEVTNNQHHVAVPLLTYFRSLASNIVF